MFNKREKNPFIYNFKFKIFPDINIHNIDEINNYKNLLKKKIIIKLKNIKKIKKW